VNDVSVDDVPIWTMNEMELMLRRWMYMFSVVWTDFHVFICVVLSNNTTIYDND